MVAVPWARRSRSRTTTRGVAARARVAASVVRSKATEGALSAVVSAAPELRRRAGVDDESESSHLLGEPNRVTGRRAVGDDRAPAREGLETGDSARRVHDDVCGREQLAHPVREAENREARLAAEGVLELRAPLGCPSGQADDVSAFELQRGANRAFEVSHRPAAARDEHDRAVARKAERAARLGFRARDEELVGDERRDRPGAARDRRRARPSTRGCRASRGADRRRGSTRARARRSP